MSRRITNAMATLTITGALLASCGGGGGSASFGGGIGGSGIVLGVITDFGSVVVEGIEFDVSGATITVDGRPATEAELAVGMVVTVRGEVDANGTSGVADSVEFESLVEGPIESVDATTREAVVLGNPIRAADDTILDGVAFEPSDVGSIVQVSGFVDSAGDVRATRIARVDPAAPFVLGGIIRALDLTAQTFRIRLITVDISNAVVSGVPPGGLRNGLAARVVVSTPPSAGVVQADAVVVREIAIDKIEDVRVLLRGIVTTALDAGSFVLNDTVRVEVVRETELVNGSTADLDADAMLEVVGLVTRARSIVAERITLRSGNALVW